MKWFKILRDRLRALRNRDNVIDDIDREMRLATTSSRCRTVHAGCDRIPPEPLEAAPGAVLDQRS